jgi:hypothetical protein
VVFPNCDKITPALQQFFDSATVGCNVTGDSSIAPPAQASSAGNVSPTVSTGSPAALTLADTQAYADASSSTDGLVGDAADLFGIRGLLDLLFLGVFETPEGFEL